YFGWTTTAPGILGEIITAPLNVNAMTWRTSPAATELETLVIDWIRQWMHLPEEFGGVVYDTASVGVMQALAVAREEAAPSARSRFHRGKPAQKSFRPARFQRALRARYRETATRIHACAGIFARRHGRGAEKLYGLRHPARPPVSGAESVDDLPQLWPRRNGR